MQQVRTGRGEPCGQTTIIAVIQAASQGQPHLPEVPVVEAVEAEGDDAMS